MVSMMLCVVLLNSAGVGAGSVDVEKQVSYSIRTDFAVVNRQCQRAGGLHPPGPGPVPGLDGRHRCPAGVEDASAVYKNTQEDSNVTYDIPVALKRQMWTRMGIRSSIPRRTVLS